MKIDGTYYKHPLQKIRSKVNFKNKVTPCLIVLNCDLLVKNCFEIDYKLNSDLVADFHKQNKLVYDLLVNL